MVPGINADHIDPVIDDGCKIMVEKLQDAKSSGEEQEPLKNFVNGDVENAFGPRPGG